MTRLPWLETQQSLAPAGGVSSLEPSPLPTNIQAAVFSWREIGRYEAAEMREVCRGGGHECVAGAGARHKSIRLVWPSNSQPL